MDLLHFAEASDVMTPGDLILNAIELWVEERLEYQQILDDDDDPKSDNSRTPTHATHARVTLGPGSGWYRVES
jgi:hypothetical protein